MERLLRGKVKAFDVDPRTPRFRDFDKISDDDIEKW
jgi:hypothetical protein